MDWKEIGLGLLGVGLDQVFQHKAEASGKYYSSGSIFDSVRGMRDAYKDGNGFDVVEEFSRALEAITDATSGNGNVDGDDYDISGINSNDRSLNGLRSKAKALKNAARREEDKIRALDRKIHELDAKRPWKGSFYSREGGIRRDDHADALAKWQREREDLVEQRDRSISRWEQIKLQLGDVTRQINELSSRSVEESSSSLSTDSSNSTNSTNQTQSTPTTGSTQPTQPTQPTQTVQQPTVELIGRGQYVPDGKTRAEDAIDEQYLSKNAVTLDKAKQLEALKQAGVDTSKLTEVPASDGVVAFNDGSTWYRVVNDNGETKIIKTHMTETLATSEVSRLKINQTSATPTAAPTQSTTPTTTPVQTSTQPSTTPTQNSELADLNTQLSNKMKEQRSLFAQRVDMRHQKPSRLNYRRDNTGYERAKSRFKLEKQALDAKIQKLNQEISAIRAKINILNPPTTQPQSVTEKDASLMPMPWEKTT